jgi:hypothetical protein
MNLQSPAEIAKEAREALSRVKETPQETWDSLIRLGWINAKGEVTKIFGGDADPEPGSEAARNGYGNGHKTSQP